MKVNLTRVLPQEGGIKDYLKVDTSNFKVAFNQHLVYLEKISKTSKHKEFILDEIDILEKLYEKL